MPKATTSRTARNSAYHMLRVAWRYALHALATICTGARCPRKAAACWHSPRHQSTAKVIPIVGVLVQHRTPRAYVQTHDWHQDGGFHPNCGTPTYSGCAGSMPRDCSNNEHIEIATLRCASATSRRIPPHRASRVPNRRWRRAMTGTSSGVPGNTHPQVRSQSTADAQSPSSFRRAVLWSNMISLKLFS